MAVAPHDAGAPLIRIADVDDLPGILAIERASFPAPWTERMFAEELRHDWSNVWVVEEGSERRVSAFTVFWIAYDEVHVLNIAVAPAARRRGLARRLLGSILAFAEARRASHVVLEVRPSNDAALCLYDEFHFRQIGVRPRYYADNGEDAFVLVRLLR